MGWFFLLQQCTENTTNLTGAQKSVKMTGSQLSLTKQHKQEHY